MFQNIHKICGKNITHGCVKESHFHNFHSSMLNVTLLLNFHH